MLAIKLQRVGKKHQPSYRIVVAEKRSKLGGPPVEQVGTYNPESKEASLNKERISHWLGIGAQPTVSIHNLLVKNGVISAPKIAIKMRKPEAAAVPVSDAVPATVASSVESSEVAPATVLNPKDKVVSEAAPVVEVAPEQPSA